MLENGCASFQQCHFWFLATVFDCGGTHEGCTLRINCYMWYYHICTKFHENWLNGWKVTMGTDREGERERERTQTHTQHGNLLRVLFKNSFLVTKVDWIFTIWWSITEHSPVHPHPHVWNLFCYRFQLKRAEGRRKSTWMHWRGKSKCWQVKIQTTRRKLRAWKKVTRHSWASSRNLRPL